MCWLSVDTSHLQLITAMFSTAKNTEKAPHLAPRTPHLAPRTSHPAPRNSYLFILNS